MKGIVLKFTGKPILETLAISIKCPKNTKAGQIGNVNKFFRQGIEQTLAGRISQDGADVTNNIPGA